MLSKELENLTPANLKRFAASTWIIPEIREITLKPREIRDFQVMIVIPKNARPGGHYAAVILEPTTDILIPSEQENEVVSGARLIYHLGSLISIRVNGPMAEKALLGRFEAPKFSEYGPISFTTEIVNLSDTHIRPLGTIVVKDIFGRTAAEMKLEKRNISPGASYVYTNQWPAKWLFGRYRAEMIASYGDHGQTISGVIYLWVLPIRIMTVVLLALTILILLLTGLYQRGRKHEEELNKEIEILKEKLKQRE